MRLETLSVREAREQLPKLLARFRLGNRAPVGLGSHRKTEAVMIPVDVYDELTTERASAAAQATTSLRAEGLVASVDADAITQRWVNGELSTTQMRTMIRQLHGAR